MLLPYFFQMIPEPGFDGGGKDRDAVPVPLSSAHGDLSISEIDVLHPKLQAFHQPETGAVQKHGGDPLGAEQLVP